MNDASAAEVDSPSRAASADSLLQALIAHVGHPLFVDAGAATPAVSMPGHGWRHADLFSRDTFFAQAGHARTLRAGFVDDHGGQVDVAIQSTQISRMLAAGMTVRAVNVPETGRLAGFLAACRAAAPEAKGLACDAYLAPAGSVRGLRVDPTTTLVLQIAGKRRWRYVPEPEAWRVNIGVSWPSGQETLDLPWGQLVRPAAGRMREIVLHPGDALYVPRGCWHESRAVNESLTLAVSSEEPSPLAALASAIAAGVPGTPTKAGGPLGSGRESFGMVTADMSLGDLCAAWTALVAAQTR